MAKGKRDKLLLLRPKTLKEIEADQATYKLKRTVVLRDHIQLNLAAADRMGSRIVCASEKHVRVLNAVTGNCILEFSKKYLVLSVSISQDGRFCSVVSGPDDTIPPAFFISTHELPKFNPSEDPLEVMVKNRAQRNGMHRRLRLPLMALWLNDQFEGCTMLRSACLSFNEPSSSNYKPVLQLLGLLTAPARTESEINPHRAKRAWEEEEGEKEKILRYLSPGPEHGGDDKRDDGSYSDFYNRDGKVINSMDCMQMIDEEKDESKIVGNVCGLKLENLQCPAEPLRRAGNVQHPVLYVTTKSELEVPPPLHRDLSSGGSTKTWRLRLAPGVYAGIWKFLVRLLHGSSVELLGFDDYAFTPDVIEDDEDWMETYEVDEGDDVMANYDEEGDEAMEDYDDMSKSISVLSPSGTQLAVAFESQESNPKRYKVVKLLRGPSEGGVSVPKSYGAGLTQCTEVTMPARSSCLTKYSAKINDVHALVFSVPVSGHPETELLAISATVQEVTGHVQDVVVLMEVFEGKWTSKENEEGYKENGEERMREGFVLLRSRPATAIAFSYDAELLALGGSDNLITVYSLASGEPLINVPRSSPIKSLAFGYSDNSALVAGYGNVVATFSVANGNRLIAPIVRKGNISLALVSSAGGRNALVVGAQDNRLVCYDMRGGEHRETSTRDVEYDQQMIGDVGGLQNLAASPDGQYFVVSDSAFYLRLVSVEANKTMDWAQGQQLQSSQVGFPNNCASTYDCGGTVEAIAWHPDGRSIAILTATGEALCFECDQYDQAFKSAHLFDIFADLTVSEHHEYQQNESAESLEQQYLEVVTDVTLRQPLDPNRVASNNDDNRNSAGHRWLPSWLNSEYCQRHDHRCYSMKKLTSKVAYLSVAFHPSGRIVALGQQDNRIAVCDASYRKPQNEEHELKEGRRIGRVSELQKKLITDAPVRSVAFSPSGKYFVAAAGKQLRVHSVNLDGSDDKGSDDGGEPISARPILQAVRPQEIKAVVFSPDSCMLAVCNDDSVGIFRLGSELTKLHELEHESTVTSISFSDDSLCLAVAAGPLVLLYNVEDSVIRHCWCEKGGGVSSVQFTAKGHLMVTGSCMLSNPKSHPDGVNVSEDDLDQHCAVKCYEWRVYDTFGPPLGAFIDLLNILPAIAQPDVLAKLVRYVKETITKFPYLTLMSLRTAKKVPLMSQGKSAKKVPLLDVDIAAARGESCVQRRLKTKQTLNIQDVHKSNNTPHCTSLIHFVIKQSQLRAFGILNHILAKYPHVATEIDESGHTPFHFAFSVRDQAAVLSLFRAALDHRNNLASIDTVIETIMITLLQHHPEMSGVLPIILKTLVPKPAAFNLVERAKLPSSGRILMGASKFVLGSREEWVHPGGDEEQVSNSQGTMVEAAVYNLPGLCTPRLLRLLQQSKDLSSADQEAVYSSPIMKATLEVMWVNHIHPIWWADFKTYLMFLAALCLFAMSVINTAISANPSAMFGLVHLILSAIVGRFGVYYLNYEWNQFQPILLRLQERSVHMEALATHRSNAEDLDTNATEAGADQAAGEGAGAALKLDAALNDAALKLDEASNNPWISALTLYVDVFNLMDILSALLSLTSALNSVVTLFGVSKGSQQASSAKSFLLVQLSINMLCSFAGVLYFYRGIPRLAHLVDMLMQIIADMQAFVVILATLIVGFAFSFHALFAQSREEVPGFRNIISSMFTTYSMAVFGDVDSDSYEHSASPTIMIVLVMGLQVFILIVMMNALIAIMGDTFEHMQESQEASKQKLRAAMCCEFMDMMDEDEMEKIVQNTRWIHILKPMKVAGSEDGTEGGGEWTGRMAVIRNIVHGSSRRMEQDMSTALQRIERLELNVDKILAAVSS